jgi:hypothetical protein
MSRTKKELKKAKAKASKPVTRLSLPSNKRHKTKKDYKRTKVKKHEVEME